MQSTEREPDLASTISEQYPMATSHKRQREKTLGGLQRLQNLGLLLSLDTKSNMIHIKSFLWPRLNLNDEADLMMGPDVRGTRTSLRRVRDA